MVVELSKEFQAQYNKLISTKTQYRNSRTGARSTRTQIDHDVFEGLPVRHWRKKSFHVNAVPEKDNLDPLGTGDTGWQELPMPRDAHMYSPMSEALLRAARMGQVKKPATPLMDDEKEPGEDEDADGDFDLGFMAKRWAVLPKDMEGPEPEFLAKRRKGLPSVYTGATGPLGNSAQMRKTKIRKVDTEGNSYVWEVLVPEGQAVDGEIVEEQTIPTQVPAPGTIVEGLGVVNAEGIVIAGDQALPAANRKRPPPPKRKAKGPGRGRKKKVAFMPGTEGAASANGVSDAVLNGSSGGAADGKSAKMKHGVPDGDTEMGDESVLQEGEEGSEEASEGEEGEDGDREEGELSPSPTPAKSPADPPTIVVNEFKVEPTNIVDDATPSPSKLPLSSPTDPAHQETLDPMLLDDYDNGDMGNILPEPTATSIFQGTDAMTDAAEVSEGTTPIPESILRTSETVIERPYAASMADLQKEVQKNSTTALPSDTTLQCPPEPVENLATDKTTESLVKQPEENPANSMTKLETEPTPDVPAEHLTEAMAVSTAAIVGEQRSGASADPAEKAKRMPRSDDLVALMTGSVPALATGAEPETMTNTLSTPPAEVIAEPDWEPNMELPSELLTESVVESVVGPEHVTEQPTAEQPMAKQPMAEQPMAEQPMAEQPMAKQPMAKQPMAERPMTEQPTVEQPVVERPVVEQPTTEQSTIEQPMIEQPTTEQPVTEWPVVEQPTTEQPTIEQPMIEQPVIEQPVTEQPVTEQPVTEQPVTEESMAEQPVTEPWAGPATEPFPEALSPERRFSYTRVTSSPQAPTPSPPTPIESTFGLKAPYLSPKAPTMSPPTPIERSMSSSPDIPLADQHFRLPPQIDAAQEAGQAPALDMPHITGANRISVEAESKADSQVKAQLPIQHDPLDGMAEPMAADGSEGSPQHFTDGEEDLLGSLERSLGKHSGRS